MRGYTIVVVGNFRIRRGDVTHRELGKKIGKSRYYWSKMLSLLINIQGFIQLKKIRKYSSAMSLYLFRNGMFRQMMTIKIYMYKTPFHPLQFLHFVL